nr:FAD-dependent thymidylate synthase [Pseudomonas sp.]
MQVRLVAITKPVIPEASTPGELIAYCARVSNPANQGNTATAPKLLRYLLDNKHVSPLEMAHMVLEIETTRDIARQILRHRSFSFQEWSGRYSEMPDEPVLREARMQDTKNRQNSLPCNDDDLQEAWENTQAEVMGLAVDRYQWALRKGVAKEVARAVLPEGMTQSRLYMSGTVRSFLHYVEVRTDPSTQKEHREVAQACAAILYEQFPELQA